jgi:uncharacterized protein YkwD
LAAASVVVVIGGGFTVAGLAGGSDPAARTVSDEQAQQESAVDAEDDATVDSDEPTADPADSASPSAAAKRTTAPTRAATTAPRRTTKAPAPRKPPPAAAGGSVVQQVLAHINAARREEGLRTLTLSANLSRASTLHTQRMTGACGLSHRCSGEADLGDRFTAQGVRWSSAGENIGFGSAGSSDTAIIGAANGLTDNMLAERPPDDGHRKNLLSKSFTTIGLSVVRDDRGRVWLTQDFTG